MNHPVRDLPVPATVNETVDAREILRVWTSTEGERVTLRVEGLAPMAWGLFLVDIAKHVSYAYARAGTITANDAFAEILSGFIAEVGLATDQPTPTEGPE